MDSARQVVFQIGWISLLTTPTAFSCVVMPRVLREFSRAGLEGRHFYQYYGLFLPLVWVTFLLLTGARLVGTKRLDKVWWWVLFGALAGYLSGIISLTCVDFFRPDGWGLFIRESSSLSDWLFRAAYPAVSLNWLIGALAAFMSFYVRRLIRSRLRL